MGKLSLATFSTEVTPPVGSPLQTGFGPPVSVIEHPLLAKGVVLTDGDTTVALCSIDWVGLCGASHRRMREAIAEAAQTSADCVAVQTVHQHTAPTFCDRAQEMLDTFEDAPPFSDTSFFETVMARIQDAVREAVEQYRPVSRVAHGWAAVDRVAAARRIVQPDGTVLSRFSKTTDEHLVVAPEGVIDGYVRSVSFEGDEAPLAQLHYYATHPQTYYRDGRVTYDMPGLARERLESESGVFQVYFTGCSGNVTMGKYNNGTPESRSALADRLYDGMVRALRNSQSEEVTRIEWRTEGVCFPLRSDEAFSKETNLKTLGDPSADIGRIRAALNLSFIEQMERGEPVLLSSLGLGSIRILHLPGEPFVEYQLWAQQHAGDRFVAVAGYGDCGMWYIGLEKTYSENGGYELNLAYVDPSEQLLKDAMSKLL